MTNINIGNEVLLCILMIVVILCSSFLYYTKRRFDSIDKYNKLVSDKLNTYKENQEQYNENLSDLGIKAENKINFLAKIIKIFRRS